MNIAEINTFVGDSLSLWHPLSCKFGLRCMLVSKQMKNFKLHNIFRHSCEDVQANICLYSLRHLLEMRTMLLWQQQQIQII